MNSISLNIYIEKDNGYWEAQLVTLGTGNIKILETKLNCLVDKC